MIRIEPYSSAHFDAPLEFVAGGERAACAAVPSLPAATVDARRASLMRATGIAEGVVARDEVAELTGLLLFTGPHKQLHGDHICAYAPLTGFAVRGEHIDLTTTGLFRAAAALDLIADVDTWAIATYTHSADQMQALAMNGSGARVADAVVAIDDIPDVPLPAGLTFSEISPQDAVRLLALKQGLDTHLTQNPTYLTYFGFTEEKSRAITERRQCRHVAAIHGSELVAFLEFTAEGENYLTRDPHTINICGAYTLPKWRGTGVMSALLSAAMPAFREQGITTVGIDYETINPEARFFWERTFTPYTRSWERRRDRIPAQT